jgi:hypothetical protein
VNTEGRTYLRPCRRSATPCGDHLLVACGGRKRNTSAWLTAAGKQMHGSRANAREKGAYGACEKKARVREERFHAREERRGRQKSRWQRDPLLAYIHLGGGGMPTCQRYQVGLPICWRSFFLILPKFDGCQVDMLNCWNCS